MKTKLNYMTATALLGASLIIGSLPAQAQEAEARNYAGVQGGLNNLNRWNAKVGLGSGVVLDGHADLDSGTQFGLVIGRETEKARYELEYQRGSFDLTGIQLGPISQVATGGGKYQALTFNAYRTKRFDEKWGGYLGLGIGWGSATLPQVGFDTGCNCFVSGVERGWVYQGRVGVEYRHEDKHRVFAQYTLLSMPGPKSANASFGANYVRKNIGIVGVGYRYIF